MVFMFRSVAKSRILFNMLFYFTKLQRNVSKEIKLRIYLSLQLVMLVFELTTNNDCTVQKCSYLTKLCIVDFIIILLHNLIRWHCIHLLFRGLDI